jgi:hypothetical protein
VETSEIPGLKPNGVVPFKINKETASERYLNWIKKKFFTPKIFKKHAMPDDLHGVYNPGFTFDAKTFSSYHGVLGKYYYVTKKRSDGSTYQERKIEYFNIKGVYSDFFNDILIQASSRIEQKTLNALAPWNTDESNKYSENFLFGFSANSNDKEGMECWKEARGVIDTQIRKRILSKYHYDTVESLNISTQCSNITYKYLMLPVYVGNCGWKQKIYNFFINGFSGKVSGKAPISGKKVFFTILFGTLLVAGAAIGAYFLTR